MQVGVPHNLTYMSGQYGIMEKGCKGSVKNKMAIIMSEIFKTNLVLEIDIN